MAVAMRGSVLGSLAKVASGLPNFPGCLDVLLLFLPNKLLAPSHGVFAQTIRDLPSPQYLSLSKRLYSLPVGSRGISSM